MKGRHCDDRGDLFPVNGPQQLLGRIERPVELAGNTRQLVRKRSNAGQEFLHAIGIGGKRVGKLLRVLDRFGERPRASPTNPPVGKHAVGALEDVLRGLQQVGHRRRIGDDLGDRAVRLGFIEDVGLLGNRAFQLDIGLSGEAGQADVGLGRTGDRRIAVDSVSAIATAGLSTSMKTRRTSPTLTPLNMHSAAARQSRSGARNADAQFDRLATIADGGGPVDKAEGGEDRRQA